MLANFRPSFQAAESPLFSARWRPVSWRQTRPWAIWLALFTVVAGCQTAVQHPLVGKWELTQAAELADRVGQPAPDASTSPTAQNNSQEFDQSQAKEPPMVIHFCSDGVLETATKMGGIQSKKQGTWEIKAEGPPLVIAFVINGQPAETEIEWIGNDQIKMVPPNLTGLTMKLVFRRQQ